MIFLSNVSESSLFQSKGDLFSSTYISGYLKGSLAINHSKYSEANFFFSKIKDLEKNHDPYSFQYIFSLALDGKINEANKLIVNLKDINKDNYLLQLIQGIYQIKNRNYQSAQNIFINANIENPLLGELNNYINLWLNIYLSEIQNKVTQVENFKSSFDNIKLIQSLLIYDFINNKELYDQTSKKILQQQSLGRYHFFHSIHLIKEKQFQEVEKILIKQIEHNPNDLLIKQSYVELKEENFSFFSKTYESNNINHGISELLYLFANLMQQQQQLDFSKLLNSLSHYLNPNFTTNNLLNYENAILHDENNNFLDKKLQDNIASLGSEYQWYINFSNLLKSTSDKKINTEYLLGLLEKKLSNSKYFNYSKLIDLGNYYRSIKNYKRALSYYSQAEAIAISENKNWKIHYYKGICNERLGNFDIADQDFLLALKYSPQEYVVINYLAFSWLERGVNLEKSKLMLEKAVRLSKWELGYIIDSLGWAHYLLNNYQEAEKILQIAYEKTTAEAEVYDHYADILWKNNKKIQARYIWKKATNLSTIDEERLKKINKKLIHGL